MIKISDIMKRVSRKGTKEERASISDAIRMKESQESLPEIKKVYEDLVGRTRQIMEDVQEERVVEGDEIFRIAEIITDKLRYNNNNLLSLINIFACYGERNDFLYSHSVNVAILSTNMGIALGFEENEFIDLCGSSLLHDLGMLKIPDEIAYKTAPLTEEEYGRIKEHPIHGLKLLKNIKNLPQSAADVVYQHHEKEDGSGYPEGKKGGEISDCAKIAAIIEVYEALTHPRPHRQKRFMPYEAVKIVVQEEKNSFDKAIIKTFFNVITPYPLGSFVLLNSGEIGRVVGINENLPLRPVVDIYFDAEGKPPEQPTDIDLAKSPILHIEKALDDSEL